MIELKALFDFPASGHPLLNNYKTPIMCFSAKN